MPKLLRRIDPRWLAFGFFILVLGAYGSMHLRETDVGKPYETWDEIATYNTALVLTGPTASRVYRYGTIDTALQRLAVEAYRRLDPVGQAVTNAPYSNNVPRSFFEPDLNRKPRTWTGVDYNYFRGLEDRTPIFWSRKLHLAASYLIAALTGCFALRVYGLRGVALLLPLIAFIAAPTMYYQAARSLPMAPAALLGFLCTVAAMTFHDRGRTIYLVISAAALALAGNFRIDALVFGVAPALALILMTRERGLRFGAVAALQSGATFVATTLITRPPMFLGPVRDFQARIGVIRSTLAELELPMLSGAFTFDAMVAKIQSLARYLGTDGVVTLAPDLAVLAIFTCGLAALIGVLMVRRSRNDVTVAIGVTSGLLIWGFLLWKYPSVAERYWVTGMAALMATAGMFATLNLRTPALWPRLGAYAVLVVIGLQFAANTVLHAQQGLAIERNAIGPERFDGYHNRNNATVAAIELARAKNLEVLVDQHAYIDTRLFHKAGVELRPLNKYNVDKVLTGDAPKLVLFSRGSTDQSGLDHVRWAGSWSEPEKALYRAYQERLLSLPVVRRYEGDPHLVLNVGPVRQFDEIVLAVTTNPPVADE